MINRLVIRNVNTPTITGRVSWFMCLRLHLGGMHTTLHEVSACSVKKTAAPIIRQEESKEPDIPDVIPIDGRLRVNETAGRVHSSP